MVIQAIITSVKNTNERLDTVIDSFETTYKEEANLSMAKMATIVQNFGLVTRKKSRGKTKKGKLLSSLVTL
jgi:hypothetical protein